MLVSLLVLCFERIFNFMNLNEKHHYIFVVIRELIANMQTFIV